MHREGQGEGEGSFSNRKRWAALCPSSPTPTPSSSLFRPRGGHRPGARRRGGAPRAAAMDPQLERAISLCYSPNAPAELRRQVRAPSRTRRLERRDLRDPHGTGPGRGCSAGGPPQALGYLERVKASPGSWRLCLDYYLQSADRYSGGQTQLSASQPDPHAPPVCPRTRGVQPGRDQVLRSAGRGGRAAQPVRGMKLKTGACSGANADSFRNAHPSPISQDGDPPRQRHCEHPPDAPGMAPHRLPSPGRH